MLSALFCLITFKAPNHVALEFSVTSHHITTTIPRTQLISFSILNSRASSRSSFRYEVQRILKETTEMANTKKISGDDDNLLVPTTTEEVTEDWLVKALKLDMEKGTLVITSNIHAGSGYLSNMLRAKFVTKNEQGDNEELSFVVKLLPEEEFTRAMVKSEKMDKSELGVYQELLPEYIKEIPSLEPYVCPFLYGKIQEENVEQGIKYSSVLVLKDLKCDGYFPKPFESHKISSEEINFGIDFLAKFHSAGKLLEIRKGKRLNELFDFFPEWYYPNEDENRVITMQAAFDTGFGFTRQAIKDYIAKNPLASDKGNKLISELIDPLEPMSKKLLKFILKAGQKEPTAIHGDLWQNNILFSEGPNSPIIAIDWQLLGYADPVFDLGMLVLFSLQDDMSRDAMKGHVKRYYDKVEELYAQMKAKGLSVPSNRRSWDDLWQTYTTVGLIYVFILIVMSGEILVTHPENNAKAFNLFAFLLEEMKIIEFIMKNVN